MLRSLVVLAAVAAVAVIPLGPAAASPTTAKRIAYISGLNLFTIGANGTGTSNLGVVASNPSFSSDGQLIVYDNAVNISSIAASGGSATVLCPGSNPAISPDKTKLAYVLAGSVKVNGLNCATGTPIDFGAGSDPAWAPDNSEIVFVDSGGDIAVAPAAGGAPQKLGTTAATESSPSWSPDGTKIAYIANGELFVMNADGSNRQQLTSNSVAESSPSWAPGGDEIVYAANNSLYAITANGSSTRLLADATAAAQPDWGLAVANTVKPTITAQAGAPFADGTQLSAGNGSWISVSGITSYSYQWLRCSSAGTGCTSIAGATGGTYTLASEDIGGTVRVRVTATTPDGSAPGTSNATPVISAAAPKNTVPPTISGNAAVGETLTASPGTWSGTNPVFSYQWQRCDANGTASSCANLSGATSNTYVPVNEDVGFTLRVVVTATNSVGSTSKESGTTPVVATTKPTNTSLPAILETLASDGTVSYFTATTGNWTGAATITYRYQWRRCDSAGGNCSDIAGATTSTYTPSSLDVGTRVRVAVTATNSYGSATAVSEPSRLLAGNAPVNTVRPTITGTATSGSVLFATTGTWTGTAPLTYTYEWRRCNASGASCGAIAGATAQSYVLQSTDVGSTIVVAVTARNAAGSATVTSAPTAVVQAGTTPATRPGVSVPPSIVGVLAKGQTLTANPGIWTGTTPMTFTYQWQRCAATGTTCTSISTATRSTYKLTKTDVGKRIRLIVIASNSAGSGQGQSAISKKIAAKAPSSGKTIKGTQHADRLKGTAGADTIRGAGGNDRIDGAAGDDKLYGDSGNDSIIGGRGLDKIFGGAGNDTIRADDGELDNVDCGAGKDKVVADKIDKVKGCEKVTRRATSKRAATPL